MFLSAVAYKRTLDHLHFNEIPILYFCQEQKNNGIFNSILLSGGREEPSALDDAT